MRRANVIAATLFFFIALVCIALFMPVVIEAIDNNITDLETATSGNFLGLLVKFFPMFIVIMVLFIYLISLRQ